MDVIWIFYLLNYSYFNIFILIYFWKYKCTLFLFEISANVQIYKNKKNKKWHPILNGLVLFFVGSILWDCKMWQLLTFFLFKCQKLLHAYSIIHWNIKLYWPQGTPPHDEFLTFSWLWKFELFWSKSYPKILIIGYVKLGEWYS